MDVKDAVVIAKKYFAEAFSGEGTNPPRLEEVWFDTAYDHWFVTLSVFRTKPKEMPAMTAMHPLSNLLQETYLDYKTVEISAEDGTVISIKNRELAA
jgi:hypothetical protein